MPAMCKCAVVGCRNNFKDDRDKHTHKFPKDKAYRDVWIMFARRGSEFKPSRSSAICEDHFHPSCFKFSFKKLYLLPRSVPTICKAITGESIVLTFDPDLFTYLESDKYLIPAYDKDDREQELCSLRDERLKNIKTICRFCAEELTTSQRVAINKLKDYSISPSAMLTLVGISTSYNHIFSEVLCEECFQNVVSFDGFRKRCVKAQDELREELKKLDEKLQAIRGQNADSSEWNSGPVETWNDDDDSDKDDHSETSIVDYIAISNTSIKKEKISDYEPIYFHDVTIKSETKDEPCSDIEDNYEYPPIVDENNMYEADVERETKVPITPKVESPKVIEEEVARNDDNVDWRDSCVDSDDDATFDIQADDFVADDSDLETAGNSKRKGPRAMFESVYYKPSKTGDDEKSCSRKYQTQVIYECFYCHLKYAGRDMFTRHDCQITEVECSDKNCKLKFKSMSGFNSHVVRLHKLPKLTRALCKVCKLSMVITEEDFKNHARKCDKNFANKVSKTAVECSMCKKLYPNQQMLSVHMLFHAKSKDEVAAEIDKSIAEAREQRKQRRKKTPRKEESDGSVICEHCGKAFAKPKYLREHVNRLHELFNTQPAYQCDLCGKKDKTRRGIGKHVKNVHLINPVSCHLCGKVFKNKNTMSYHMKYHDNSKYIHFCPLCPDRAPWCTAVALKRHQESNHGNGAGYPCDFCNGLFISRSELRKHKLNEHGVQ